MPTVYTGKATPLLALGYKKAKEEKRRYDQEFEENVKTNKSNRNANTYNSAMDAYASYLTSKANRAEKKKLLKDTDHDGRGEYTADELASSSVRANNIYDSEATKKAYENPSDEANSDAYKNSLFNAKRNYSLKKSKEFSKYKVK